MELYGQILNYAMPAFLILVLAEKAYGWVRFRHAFNTPDTVSSLSSGLTNVLKDVLGLSVSIFTYGYMLKYVAVFHVPAGFWTFLVAFIALDFSGYWVHRLSHEYNLLWNKHSIHHSSEEFNLACALRQSISQFVNLFTFFLLPAAFFGVPQDTIALVAPIHLFAQFWYHTVYIKKMGFLEHIIVTPSHHRVHHAINPEYLDKNHSQIFIIWDKLFGTFAQEKENIPPVYGITRPVATWNPIKINFQHLWLLIQDAYRAKSIKDKLKIWLMPTGWRPEDVDQKYPIQKITDPYHFTKYSTSTTPALNAWTWFQFMSTYGFIAFFFANLGSDSIVLGQKFVYALFIFASVYAFTELLDHNPAAWVFESIKVGIGFYLLYIHEGWFGLSASLNSLITAYLIICVPTVLYFVYVDKKLKIYNLKPHF